MKKLRAPQGPLGHLVYDEMSSPVGTLALVTGPDGLHAVLWDNDHQRPPCEEIIKGLRRAENDKTVLLAKKQLAEYFQGKRKIFEIPLALQGTAFQMQAWEQLLKIPYATTMSYAKQAEKMGNKNKARAVGSANGLNPIAIIVPCHRVIGSNGHLAGFAGGLDKKAFLLKLEQQNN